MPSVFEKFGIKKDLTSTSIPQLGINSELSKLQFTSQMYFTIGKDAKAADGNKLGVVIQGKQNFTTKNPNHIHFLNQCVTLFKEKSTQLKSIDNKILGSVAFGATATALSFLPIIGFVGWIGWAAASYFINKRATAYQEYHETLALLVAACNWSLGEGINERIDSVDTLTKDESIRDMMTMLYPVLSETQVRHLIADDIEELFTKELSDYEQKFQLRFEPKKFFPNEDNRIALSKKGAEVSRCIYGFNRGGFTDFLDAIVTVLPDLYRAAIHGCQQLKQWVQEKIHTDKNADQTQEHQVKASI